MLPIPPSIPTPSSPPHISAMPPEARHSKGSAGPTVGIIIIVIVFILGGLYFWGQRLNQKDAQTLPLIPGDTTSTQ